MREEGKSVWGTGVCCAFGAFALLIFGMQPLLYGGYVREGLLPERLLGVLAAAAVIAIAIGSAAAIPFLRRVDVRWVAILAIAVNASGNLMSAGPGATITLLGIRAWAGIGAGLMVGISAAAIARTTRIGSWSAASGFGQAFSQFVVMSIFSRFVTDAGSGAVQNALVVLTLLCTLLIPFLPRDLSVGAAQEIEIGRQALSRRPTSAALACLVAMFLYVGGAAAMWAYAGLWMESGGVSPTAGTTILTVSLAGQMLGSLVSVFVPDGRRDWFRMIAMTTLFVGSSLAWLFDPGAALFAFGYGVFWMGGGPALASVLASVDQDRLAVPYGAAVQIAGVALIPTLVGAMFGEHQLFRLAMTCVALVASSGVIVAAIVAATRPARIPGRRGA